MYEVSVDGGFTASHAIPGPDGRIESPHEHRWSITAVFRGERLDAPMGVLIDFLAVRATMEDIETALNGTDLNEHPAFRDTPPSAEAVAEFLARELTRMLARELAAGDVRLHRLEVTEAPGCRAAFMPSVDPGTAAH